MTKLTARKRQQLRTLQNKLIKLCESVNMKPYDEILYHISLDNLRYNIYPNYEKEILSTITSWAYHGPYNKSK